MYDVIYVDHMFNNLRGFMFVRLVVFLMLFTGFAFAQSDTVKVHTEVKDSVTIKEGAPENQQTVIINQNQPRDTVEKRSVVYREKEKSRYESGIGFGPIVGYQKAGDAESGSFLFGVQLRAKLASVLGIEGAISYRTEEYANNVQVTSWPVTATGLIYVLPNLYGAIGVGWHNTSIEYDNAEFDIADKTSSNFGWHLGGGVEIPVSEIISLSGDLRYVFLEHDFEDLTDAAATSDDINSNFYMIQVGLIFGF